MMMMMVLSVYPYTSHLPHRISIKIGATRPALSNYDYHCGVKIVCAVRRSPKVETFSMRLHLVSNRPNVRNS